MKHSTLGRTGLEVSEVGFGAAPLGIPHYLEKWDPVADDSRRSAVHALHHALERGINYWDTAAGYGDGLSEEVVGQALKGRRDRVVIATKVGGEISAESVIAGAEASLRRLGVDSIDIFQFHGGHYEDGEDDRILGPGLDAMHQLREDGKIRFIGITAEGSTPALERMIATGSFDTLQICYNFCYQHPCNLTNPRAGTIWRAKEQNMGVITMRTLTSGLFQRTMAAVGGADAPGFDANAFLLNYVLSNPLVDVALVGMRRVEEVDRNVQVAETAERLDLEALHHRFPLSPVAGADRKEGEDR